MNEDPASDQPQRPENAPGAQGSDWLDQEVARRKGTPMFYSDLPHHHKPGRRSHSPRSKDGSKKALLWVIVILVVIGAGVGGYFLGKNAPVHIKTAPVVQLAPYQANGQVLKAIDAFYKAKDAGNYEESLKELITLAKEHPSIPGLDYQLAEIAFKIRRFDEARIYAEEGIRKNDAAASCQMILGLMAWQNRKTPMFGGFEHAAYSDMKKATEMAPFASLPFYFLGEFKREGGDIEEGSKLLLQAASRLDPLDSYIVMSIKAKLAYIQTMKDHIRDGNMPPDIHLPPQTLSERFQLVLVRLYQGKFDEAAEILTAVQAYIPKELFIVLINDPAIREFQLESPMQKFYLPPQESPAKNL